MVNVNGVWRDIETQLIRHNGVWRKVDDRIQVNGVWRQIAVRKNFIDETMIRSFVLVYSENTFENYKGVYSHNSRLKDVIHVSAMDEDGNPYNGETDRKSKSILFQYSLNDPHEFGMFTMVGNLYAVVGDIRIDVGSIPDSKDAIRTHMNLVVNCHARHQNKGRPFNGYNRIFTSEDFFSDNYDGNLREKYYSQRILPAFSRKTDYAETCRIGIVRSPEVDENIISCEGYLEHVFTSVEVNGTTYPFSIEIHNR